MKFSYKELKDFTLIYKDCDIEFYHKVPHALWDIEVYDRKYDEVKCYENIPTSKLEQKIKLAKKIIDKL